MTRASAAFAALCAATLAAGCSNVECVKNTDCPFNFVCTIDGACVESAQGDIVWVSPEPGSVVGPVFDAVVEVSFRAREAEVFVDRAVADPGDKCAPFIPQQLFLPGDLDEALHQTVTLPGLLAAGDSFSVTAALFAAGGLKSTTVPLRSEASAFGGATFELGERENLADASASLSMPVRATLDGLSSAFISVEPVGGASSGTEVLGNVDEVDVDVPLARGPQVVKLTTIANGEPRVCGLGVNGVGAPGQGLELGLLFEGAQPGQLDLRLLIERASGDEVCSFTEPSASCTPSSESRAPARIGQEILEVDGQGEVTTVTVAMVPGAVSDPMSGRVRVSSNGVHAGWLGPATLDPRNGESVVLGTVVLSGALATVTPAEVPAVTPGEPF